MFILFIDDIFQHVWDDSNWLHAWKGEMACQDEYDAVDMEPTERVEAEDGREMEIGDDVEDVSLLEIVTWKRPWAA